MKICYIANGESGHATRWIEWFIKHGHKVFLITHKASNVKGIEREYVFPFKEKGGYIPRPAFILKIRHIIKQIKPDIVHAHYLTPFGMYGALTKFHPLVVSCWGSDIGACAEKSKLVRIGSKYVLKKADLIHVGDEHGKERVEELEGKGDKIFIQPWGVDLSLFNIRKYSTELRTKLNVNGYMVLCARYLKEIYSVDVLIKAIPYVIREINDVKFVFVGSGPLKENLKNLAKKLGIEKNVMFIGGIQHNKMAKYLASSDILIETYVAEKPGGGIGTINMEASACGVPLIHSEKPYLTKQGKSLMQEQWFFGLTYEPKNSKDLSDKIIQLLKHKTIRKQIGKKEIEIAKKIGNFNKNMNDFENIYKKLIERG